jgi:transcriptional regulator with GAF, ATPase, and Fis domain
MFCTQCELISENNTARCIACGSLAVLSLSRLLGGSLRGQETAHLVRDAEIKGPVRSVLDQLPHSVADDSSAALRVMRSAGHYLRQCAPTEHGEEINLEELELEPEISIITEKAKTMTNATGAAVALRHGDEIICRARSGCSAPDLGARLGNDSTFSAECIRTGEVLLCNDAENSPRVDSITCRGLGVRSILASPLRHSQRTLGVFEVLSSQPNAFDDQHIAIVQSLSVMMVLSMQQLWKRRPAASGVGPASKWSSQAERRFAGEDVRGKWSRCMT